MTVLTVTTPVQTNTTQLMCKHKCKPHNTNDQVNEIIGQTHTSKTLCPEHEDKDPHDS